jgi:hypothetical protein
MPDIVPPFEAFALPTLSAHIITGAKGGSRVQILMAEASSPETLGFVEKVLRFTGTDPKVVETFVALVLEDANWHSVHAVSQTPEAVEAAMKGIPGAITAHYHWSVDDCAMFGVSLLKNAGLKSKARALAMEALKEFPDAWVDLGLPKTAALTVCTRYLESNSFLGHGRR